MPETLTPLEETLDTYPIEVRGEDDAEPEAIVQAQAAQLENNRVLSSYAADQSNIARATGRYLDGLGEDRDVHRSGDEKDESYRQRVLAVPDVVTPLAIMKAVNAVLAPYTSIKSQYLESIQDRAYLRFSVPPMDSGDPDPGNCCAIINDTPNYPARLYPEDEAVNGAARVQCSPGGMWLFGDRIGRYFVLRVPDLSPLDDNVPAMYFENSFAPGDPVAAALPNRLFLRTTGSDPPKSFLYKNSKPALDVYGAVISAVQAIIGHSIRWKMISDTTLQ